MVAPACCGVRIPAVGDGEASKRAGGPGFAEQLAEVAVGQGADLGSISDGGLAALAIHSGDDPKWS